MVSHFRPMRTLLPFLLLLRTETSALDRTACEKIKKAFAYFQGL